MTAPQLTGTAAGSKGEARVREKFSFTACASKTTAGETDVFDSRNSLVGRIPNAHLENAELTRQNVADTFACFSEKLGFTPGTTDRAQRATLNAAVARQLNVLVAVPQ